MNYNALEDEKECDGSAKPIHTSLLTFRHAVSATGGLGENHSYFCSDSNPSPPSLAVGLPAEQYTGGCHFGNVSLFPYIIID